MSKFQQFKWVFLLSSILIVLPAIESSWFDNAFGLKWGSEKLMYYFSVFLVPLKLAMVITGCWLLIYFVKHNEVSSKVKLAVLPLMFVASVQVIMLSITSVYYVFNGTKADNYIEQANISIQSQAPGKLLTAFHDINIMCDKGFGFYTLLAVAKEPWLGKALAIESYEPLEQLTISFTENNKRQFKHYDLQSLSCKH